MTRANKLKKYYFLLFFYIQLWCVSQGIVNNGAQIVLSGSAQIYIAGGSSGSYLSQAGGIIVPSTLGVITMEGNWTNNSANTGFFSDLGTVVLAGAAQSINGTNSTTFFNLNLQGSGTKTQNLNTFVGGVVGTNGVLSLNTRPYNLNSFTLTITNPAIGGITSTGGYIISETNLALNPSTLRWNMGVVTGAHVYPFGTVSGVQIPFTFNKTSGGAADISVSTRPTVAGDNLPWSNPVGHMFSPVINGNGSIPVVIDRWWDILSTGAANADVIFSYRGIENTLSAPYNTSNLGAQNWNAAWYPPIGSNLAVGAGVGNVAANGLAILSNSAGATPWVLSSLLAPLPIELVDFSAACLQNDKVILNWSTASEKNASHFEIMNSTDGVSFSKVVSVKAAGNSTSIKKYSYVVENKNSFGNYYRLKLVDNDLSFKNSEIEFVSDNCDIKNEIPNIYYNQQSGIVITSTSKEQTNYTLNIIDAAGRLIRNDNFTVNKGYNNIVLDPQLANGMYLIRLVYNNGQILSKKIIFSN